MNTLCITSRDTFMASLHMFGQAHFLDLPTGQIVLCASFPSENHRRSFVAHSDVLELPHPLSGKSVGKDIANRLAHLGVSPSDTSFDAVEKIRVTHPLMRFD